MWKETRRAHTVESGRLWWLVGAGLVSAAVLTGLVLLSVFLAGQGREKSDQWAGILSLPLALVAIAAPAIVWMVGRATTRAEAADTAAALARLREGIKQGWAREVASRQLHLPRPLQLRWRPTGLRGVQVAAESGQRVPIVSGALLDDDATRPPAASLVEALRDPAVCQLVVLGEPGAGKTTLAILYVMAAVTAGGKGDPVPVPVPVAAWDPVAVPDVADWLIVRIGQDYPQVTLDEARALVRKRMVIPVLDGLDEMPPTLRGEALARLEEAAGAGLRMMVTCRSEEFAQTTAEVGVLPQAVVVDIVPVMVDDAVTYLTQREPAGSTRLGAVTTTMTRTPAARSRRRCQPR